MEAKTYCSSVLPKSTTVNCVSSSMSHLRVLLLLWMCCISSGASQVPSDSSPALAAGRVYPLQPLLSQDTEPEFRRHLSQASRSDDDEEDFPCELTSSQRRRFYNASSHEWIVTDEVLEELDNDVQSIVACTEEDDFVLFATERRIKPSRSITIQRRLTLSAQPQGSLFRNGDIEETERRVRLTCPEEGDLLTVGSGSVTIANMIFTSCNTTGSVMVIDSRCNDHSTGGVVRLVHTEFRNHVVSNNQRLLETTNPSCANIVMENVVIRENQCESGCMRLSQNNTLRDIRLKRNQRDDNDNSRVTGSIFMMPVGSETVATNISASRNQIRLFNISESRFTLRESSFRRNTIISKTRSILESVGGSVLLSNSSAVDILDCIFLRNSGWNGGVVYSSASEFNLSNCTFRDNEAGISNGGAFYAIYETAFTLSTCTFSENNATLGAGIFSNQSTSVGVTDSRFLENNGTSGAGLYIVGGDMTIESCEFRRNNVSFGGGALATFGVNTSILDSTFLDNNASRGAACMFQDNSIVRVTGVKFARNRSFRRGAAGVVYAAHTMLGFRNVSFNRNSAFGSGGLGGEIVYLFNGSASFVDVNVTNNYAYEATLAIIRSSASFDRVLFRRNNASRYGAGFYSDSSSVTVSRSLFVGNYANWTGGGIRAREPTRLEISDTLFHNNVARFNGGAMYIFEGTALISDTNFTNNTADGDGGGCYFDDMNVTLRNLIFYGNMANFDVGGGLFMLASQVVGQVLLFEHNHARLGGGLYVDSGSSLSLARSQFTNNTATAGGGICVFNATLNIRRACVLRRNYGGSVGGGICANFHSNASISSCVFDSNAARSGGSLWIGEFSRLTVVNCSFINSTARDQGGGIELYDNTRVSITNSTFTRCSSRSEGGGISVVIDSNLAIDSCSFLRNRATKGAGVYIVDGNLSINASAFKLGRSVDSGGGVFSTNGSITIWNSSFERNIAEVGDGGGLFGENGSFFNVADTEVIRNSASHGAGVYATDANTSNFESVNFVENEAVQSGGGARVTGSIRVQSFNNCRFVRNTAGEGGCLAGISAELRITNMLCEESIARNRGGLFFGNCNVTMNDTEVISNQAHNFSGILAAENSQIFARNLSSSMNIAAEDGGGIGVVHGSFLLCRYCKFQHNMATRGAGLFIEADDSLPIVSQLQDSSVQNNSALTLGGGVLFIRPQNVSFNCNAPGATCSRVALLNTDLEDNSAGQSGAAVITTDPDRVLVSCSQQAPQNTFLDLDQLSLLNAINPRRLCSSWRRNHIAKNAPGAAIGTFGKVFSFSTNSDDETQIIGDVNSGFVLENIASGKQLPVIFVTILDAYGNGPLATIPDPLEVNMVSPNDFFQGTLTTNVINGSCNFSNVVGFKPPGNYTLRIIPSTVSLPLAELVVHVRDCEVGEEPTENRELCQMCDAVSFNFDPEQPGGCAPCPSDATCGGRFIVPKDGYWHNGPCHANVKECLTDEACSYKERQDRLRNYTEKIQDCEFNETALIEYNEVSCREGYEGSLCGSCAEDYGLSLGFKCSKCPNDFESLITLLLFTVYLLAISSFTIRGGLTFSPRDTKAAVPGTSAFIHEVVREEHHPHEEDIKVNFEMVEMMRDGYVPPEYFQKLVAQNKEGAVGQQKQQQQQSNEVELTRWIMTEIFKVMINFLQVTAVAATINVQWTEGVLVMFEASEYMGALTTAALSRPIDCLVSTSSAAVRSVWRTLLSLFVPGVVMVIFTTFWGIITYRKNRELLYFLKRITLSIIAVTYISYLGLTKLAVRVFYCVDVYDSDDIFSDSQNKVWAIDTSIQCYEREHITLIVIAILILVLVSFSFPLISALILSQNKAKHKDSSSWTMETMGFVYRAFKEQFVFWESIVMLRKACLSIIVVFSYPLGGQLQGLLALVVLLFSHYLHFAILPYRKEFHSLNSYESGSLLVSSMTFVFGLFFSVKRSSDLMRVFVTVFAITMNSLFFSFLLIVLFRNAVVHLRALLKSEDRYIDENACWWVVLKVYVKSRTDTWVRARN